MTAADIADAKIAGKETPASDPHKKADAENQGQLSGDQSTILETPVAPVGATTKSAKWEIIKLMKLMHECACGLTDIITMITNNQAVFLIQQCCDRTISFMNE